MGKKFQNLLSLPSSIEIADSYNSVMYLVFKQSWRKIKVTLVCNVLTLFRLRLSTHALYSPYKAS